MIEIIGKVNNYLRLFCFVCNCYNSSSVNCLETRSKVTINKGKEDSNENQSESEQQPSCGEPDGGGGSEDEQTLAIEQQLTIERLYQKLEGAMMRN